MLSNIALVIRRYVLILPAASVSYSLTGATISSFKGQTRNIRNKRMSSLFSSLSSDDPSLLWARAGSLFVVVVIFQLIMAKFPTEKSTKRRLQHALTGHALVQVSYVLSRSLSLSLLIFGSLGIWGCQKFFPNHLRQHFGPLLRPSELSGERLPGAFYFLIGTAITMILIEDSKFLTCTFIVYTYIPCVAL